jgi:hypothetical protein
MQFAEVAVTLNNDVLTSFWLHKWPEPPNLRQVMWVSVYGCYCMPIMDSISMCSTLCICLIWMQKAVWDGCQPQPWCNDIFLTPQVTHTQNLTQLTTRVGINVWGYWCAPMESISMCSNSVYVKCGWKKQFEVAHTLNNENMTSFWLHKWPSTSESLDKTWNRNVISQLLWETCWRIF